MLILKLKAGLGNQLFQYAYARARALRSNTDLEIDTSWYNNISPKDTVRTFDLSHYNIQAKLHNRHQSRYGQFLKKVWNKVKRDIFKENDFTFYTKYFSPIPKSKVLYVEGYFNSEKYFLDYSDVIRKELSLKNPLGQKAAAAELYIKNLITENKIPVLIHVRRGDYITNQNAAHFHGIKTNTYYTDAITTLKEKLGSDFNTVVFILASDDIEALQNDIVPLLNNSQYHILSNPDIKNYEEIYLMSLCSHFIIANSTFSWWGAWLSNNKNKVVIGPKEWVSNPKIKTPDVLPSNWIQI